MFVKHYTVNEEHIDVQKIMITTVAAHVDGLQGRYNHIPSPKRQAGIRDSSRKVACW